MRQIVWSAIAIVVAIATILVIRNHRVLFRYTYLSGLLAIVLLLLPLVPGIGREVSGARVWIGIGDVATFQPGEIAKIALAIFFAGYLVTAPGPAVDGRPNHPRREAFRYRDETTPTASITEREASILKLMAGGYSNREIAGSLHLAEGAGEELRFRHPGKTRRPRPHPGRAQGHLPAPYLIAPAARSSPRHWPGRGRHSMISTESPGKTVKCGCFSNSFAAASWDSAWTST